MNPRACHPFALMDAGRSAPRYSDALPDSSAWTSQSHSQDGSHLRCAGCSRSRWSRSAAQGASRRGARAWRRSRLNRPEAPRGPRGVAVGEHHDQVGERTQRRGCGDADPHVGVAPPTRAASVALRTRATAPTAPSQASTVTLAPGTPMPRSAPSTSPSSQSSMLPEVSLAAVHRCGVHSRCTASTT